MIENVIEFAKNDPNAFDRYKKIVNNSKFMFNDKLLQLIALSNEYEQRKIDKRHRDDINNSLMKIEK